MRLLFLGGGDWAAASLRALAGAGHELTGVVLARQRAEELEAAATDLGLPTWRVRRAGEELRRLVAELAPDLLVSVDYDLILRRCVLEAAPLGAINAHPGMLPAYRGVGVVTRAIQDGEPQVGVTVHHMDEGIDTGDLILQRAVPVGPDDDNGDVVARIGRVLPGLVVEAVGLLAEGRAPRVPQDHARASYVPPRTPADDRLRWSEPSERIHNLVRALARPNPGAVSSLGGTELRVWKTSLRPAGGAGRGGPGQVVGQDPRGPVVATGDGWLVVEEVQLAGEAAPRRPPRWPVGTRLGRDADRRPASGESM